MPIFWASNIVTRARKEGRIYDDFAVMKIIEALNAFRGKCKDVLSYNFVSIPLVYTQVVCIAVYTYFLTALVSQQYIRKKSTDIVSFDSLDAHPILLTLQFIFYMGWLKVAETMMNPFGMDDDDFDCNAMIDKNLQMSYLIVGEKFLVIEFKFLIIYFKYFI